LTVLLHYLLGDRIAALGDKITFPLRHLNLAIIAVDALHLLFVLAALGTKDWAHDESETRFGLWMVCFSSDCIKTTDASGPLEGNINCVRAFTIFAFFAALIALVSTIVYLLREENRLAVSKVLFGANVGISLFTFMSMCLFAAYFNDGHFKDFGWHYGGGFGLTVFVWLFSIFAYLLTYIIWKKTERGGPSAVTPKGSAIPTEQVTAQEEASAPTAETEAQQPQQEPTEEPSTYTTDQGGSTQEV